MENAVKSPAVSDSAYLEKFKWDRVEKAMSLAESFVHQYVRCVEQGDDRGALKAREHFEHFFELAFKTVNTIQPILRSAFPEQPQRYYQ